MKKLLLPFFLFSVFYCVAQDQRIWATYYGHFFIDLGSSVATDNLNNTFMAGNTYSFTGIAWNGHQNTIGDGNSGDGFLVKFKSNGDRIWGTYYGGLGRDNAYNVTTDVIGNVYLVGETTSSNGISSDGFQDTIGGVTDAFLVKFDSDGHRIWATYYGGQKQDMGYGVATDNSGNIYLSGRTNDSSAIAHNGFQNSYGGNQDAFLVKFDSSGNRIWATYYGGENYDLSTAVTTDLLGNIYITGQTRSINSISSNGFQSNLGGNDDAFLVKFDSDGNRIWATYYGGAGNDYGYGITVDELNNVFLTGLTESDSGISFAGYQNTIGGLYDAFIVKFDSNGNRIWATYFGGENNEEGMSIKIDSFENIYLGGDTYSTTGIAHAGYQNNLAGEENQFIAKFDKTGMLICATYFGGTGHDEGGYIALDRLGNIYLSGGTRGIYSISNDSTAFQNIWGGGSYDAYLAKFSSCSNVSLEETDFSKNISIFPNPATGNITIRSDLISKTTTISIFNSLGQQVFVPLLQQGDNSATLYTTHLAAGVYSLVLNNSSQQVSKRFLKE